MRLCAVNPLGLLGGWNIKNLNLKMDASLLLVLYITLCFISISHGAKLPDGFGAVSPTECGPVQCADAPHGCRMYVINDRMGCPFQCGYSCGAPWCALRTCDKPCYEGYVKDHMYCNTCTCLGCPTDTRCADPCPNGFLNDEHGCQTCQCKQKAPKPVIPCQAWLDCHYGYCSDDSCRCRPYCNDVNLLPDNVNVLSI